MIDETDDATYPYVRCKTDGVVTLGYAVCRHVVLDAAPIAHYAEATPARLGEVFCEGCIGGDAELAAADLVLCCERCVGRLLAAQAPTEAR